MHSLTDLREVVNLTNFLFISSSFFRRETARHRIGACLHQAQKSNLASARLRKHTPYKWKRSRGATGEGENATR